MVNKFIAIGFLFEIEKGDLINKELKIHSSQKIDIDENCSYKLYLKQYENLPYSLINMNQGIIMI